MSPRHTTLDKGHGRIERREIRVSGALQGYSRFPGLSQVAEIRKRVVCAATGEVTSESVTYVATSLTVAQASPARLLALTRGHWRIENCLHWVKDETFGEDRHVERTRHGGAVLGLLRNSAVNLLRGRLIWCAGNSLPARAQAVAQFPLLVLLFTSPSPPSR